MKALVVEIHNNSVIFLSDKGCFFKTKNNDYEIGQEVLVSMKKQMKPQRIFAYAAVACLLIFFGFGTYAYATPYTYVSLDVNPSIEYSVNRFDRVLSVIGVNDDGTEIINEINLSNLKNKNIEDAISIIIDEISASGYLDSEESGLIITTSSNDSVKDGELALKLEEVVKEKIKEKNYETIITSEVVTSERLAEAKALDVTPGKLLLVERLMESTANSEALNKEEWLQKSVKEIMAKTNQYREQQREQEEATDNEGENQEQNEAKERNANEESTNQEKYITNDNSSDNDNSNNHSKNDNYNDNSNDNYNDNSNDDYNDNSNDDYNDNSNDNYNDNSNDNDNDNSNNNDNDNSNNNNNDNSNNNDNDNSNNNDNDNSNNND